MNYSLANPNQMKKTNRTRKRKKKNKKNKKKKKKNWTTTKHLTNSTWKYLVVILRR
jgi:hypothetical protein